MIIQGERASGDSVNVFVSNLAPNGAGAGKARRSPVDSVDYVFIGLDRMSSGDRAEHGINTITHEFAHVYLHLSSFGLPLFGELNADYHSIMGGWGNRGFNPAARSGLADRTYAIPANPEFHTPKK